MLQKIILSYDESHSPLQAIFFHLLHQDGFDRLKRPQVTSSKLEASPRTLLSGISADQMPSLQSPRWLL